MAVLTERETPRHPIGVVAERTGLSLDVLRVWERRYGVVEPARAPGGQRLYSDEQIARLRLLQAATRGGRSIGQVADLASRELAALVAEDQQGRIQAPSEPPLAAPGAAFVDPAEVHALALNGVELDVVLRRALVSLGFWAFSEDVVVPLLRRIGNGWHAGRVTPAQEHLASAAVRRVLLSASELLPRAAGAGNLIVATPAGSRHEVGALLVASAAAIEGWQVTYLGIDLSAGDIADAALRTRAQMVALSVSYASDDRSVVDEILALRAQLPVDVALVVGGGVVHRLKPGLGGSAIQVLDEFADLRTVLRGEV